MKLLAALLSLLLTQTATAAPLVGLDILSLARVDSGMVAREFPDGYALGVLQGTFGDVRQNLEKVLATGKVSAFRVHLINWTCRRNNNCDANEPAVKDYLKVLDTRAKQIEEIAKKYKGKCYLSPVLEYDEKDSSKVKAWVDTAKKAAPSCAVVLSPFQGVTLPGVLVERHGNSARADIISNDGESLFDADTAKYPSQGKIIAFGWVPRFNCRVTGEKTFTAPMQRALSLCLTSTDIKQAARVLKPETPKPTRHPRQCSAVRELGAGELLKTNAEDQPNGDVRSNKPLLISKSSTPSLDVLATDGRRVSCLKYYGPYEKGYHRHYSGTCEGHSSVDIMDRAKGEWVYVKDGAICILVNAIRRKGYFR